MTIIPKKQQQIANIILEHNSLQSSAVHTLLLKNGEDSSLVTTKRTLSLMVKTGILVTTGLGRATSYALSTVGRLFVDVDVKTYCSIEPDKRYGQDRYNFDLFSTFPVNIFDEEELKFLNGATDNYRKRIKDLPSAIQKKELGYWRRIRF